MTNLSDMFVGCSSITTIPNINNWDVSQIQNMSRVFTNATNFNDDISFWNVSSVTNMYAMFFGSSEFNSDISNWERISPDFSTLGNVQRMGSMFAVAINFNRDISNWNTSNVLYMTQMFENAFNFNQPIGAWITTNVKNMNSMFSNANNFNRPLDNWIVSDVQDMGGMFQNAYDFNQSLSAWSIYNCTNFSNFMSGKNSNNYSTENTTSLLQSWSSQVGLQTSVTLDLGNINVPVANLGYIATLTGDPNNWVVNYNQLIVEYDYGYDTLASGAACLTLPGVYWSDTVDFETGGSALYSDAALTTLASAGYYSTGVNWFQVDGTGYVISSGSC
jgi:surface protein